MGTCIECGKKGEWLSICPECFAEDLIDADDKPRCIICGAKYTNIRNLGPCENGHTFKEELHQRYNRAYEAYQ